MNFEEFLGILKGRRSVRKYLPEDVPAADIERMIEAAGAAPSGGNRQNWHFLVVRSRGLKEKLLEAVLARSDAFAGQIDSPTAKKEYLAYTKFYDFFAQAPVLIAAVKKPYDSLTFRIMERYGMPRERRSSADVQGPSAAIENLLLAAHALGYGACWMTGPMIARMELEELLGIKAPDELMAIIPVGKPAEGTAGPKKKDVKEIYTVI